MAALAAMTPPTSVRNAPAPTARPAKSFLMGAGTAWMALMSPLSRLASAPTMGLNTAAKGSPKTTASVCTRPCTRVFWPSKVSRSCSRKLWAVPPALPISWRSASMASAPCRVTSRPSRIVVNEALRIALKASRPRAPKAVATRRLRSSSDMPRVTSAKSSMMSTIERMRPLCWSKMSTPAPRIACCARLSAPTRRTASRKAVDEDEASMLRFRSKPIVMSTSLSSCPNTEPAAAAFARPASKSRAWKFESWVIRSRRSVTDAAWSADMP